MKEIKPTKEFFKSFSKYRNINICKCCGHKFKEDYLPKFYLVSYVRNKDLIRVKIEGKNTIQSYHIKYFTI